MKFNAYVYPLMLVGFWFLGADSFGATVQHSKLTHDEGRFQLFLLSSIKVVCYDTESSRRPNVSVDTMQICLQALPYFEQQCEQQNALACLNLGHLYRLSPQIGIDHRMAQILYLSSCELGETAACDRLNAKHRLKLNRPSVFAKISAACKKPYEPGCVNYAKALNSATFHKQRDIQRSAKILNQECEARNAQACYLMLSNNNWANESKYHKTIAMLSGSCMPEVYEVCRVILSRLLMRQSIAKPYATIRQLKEEYLREKKLSLVDTVLAGEFLLAEKIYNDSLADELASRLIIEGFTRRQMTKPSELEQALTSFVDGYKKSVTPLLLRAAFYLGQSDSTDGFNYRVEINQFHSYQLTMHKSISALDRRDEYYAKASRDLRRVLKLDRENIHAKIMTAKMALSKYSDRKEQKKIRKFMLQPPKRLDGVELAWSLYTKDLNKLTPRTFQSEKNYQTSLKALNDLIDDTRISNPLVARRIIEADPLPAAVQEILLYEPGMQPPVFKMKTHRWYERQINLLLMSAQWQAGCHLAYEFRKFFPFDSSPHTFIYRCNKNLELMSFDNQSST